MPLSSSHKEKLVGLAVISKTLSLRSTIFDLQHIAINKDYLINLLTGAVKDSILIFALGDKGHGKHITDQNILEEILQQNEFYLNIDNKNLLFESGHKVDYKGAYQTDIIISVKRSREDQTLICEHNCTETLRDNTFLYILLCSAIFLIASLIGLALLNKLFRNSFVPEININLPSQLGGYYNPNIKTNHVANVEKNFSPVTNIISF